MAELTLSQAAKLTRKSKSTLNRAIKSGRLSAVRNEDGTFSIDPSELLRVFPETALERSSERADGRSLNRPGTGMELAEINALRVELAKAEQRAAVAEAQAAERARALEAAERNISDLRRMLPPPTAAGAAFVSTTDTIRPKQGIWARLRNKT